MNDQNSLTDISLADPWILGSLLQKAIRRGDPRQSFQAWKQLNATDPRRAKRRLMLIAFEEIGVADLELLVEATEALACKKHDEILARRLLEKFVVAAKDRSADYLFWSCIRHPTLRAQRLKIEQATDQEQLNILGSSGLELPALAAIALLDRNKGRPFGWTRAVVVRVIVERFTDDTAVRNAVELAFKKSGEAFVVMLPFLMKFVGGRGRIRSNPRTIPSTKFVDGIPMYALDKHTRVGRAAIREFIADNGNVRRCLAEYVTPESMKSAAYMAAYYTDATPISNRFVWSESDRLEICGREADMYSAGAPLEGVAPILETFHTNLVHLDEIRARLFRKKFGGGN